MNAVLLASLGTGFTFFMTALGAATVFLFGKKALSDRLFRCSLGFAAGVMIAASVWSLLIPAIDKAEELGKIGWIPASGGFALGVFFLMALDKLLPAFHPGEDRPEGVKKSLGHSTMLVFAITLHNIPEGMAQGLAFALAAQDNSKVLLAAAIALAIGMGIQNFPEGAAISLPLIQSGMSKKRAFLYGALSGILEPIFGIITVFIAGATMELLPWLLSFAAGAMLYVVVEELIPEAKLSGSHIGTFGTMAGFLIMMILDVALG
ncbi:MAG: ZIP family metal transporter [Ruminococcus sp.]|nr:ZIP family metal transporter [Ruminococcus sp.]